MNISDISFLYKIKSDAKTENECLLIYKECCKHDNIHHPIFNENDCDDDVNSYCIKKNVPPICLALYKKQSVGFARVCPLGKYFMEMVIFVLPQYRRLGIATELFSRMATNLSDCGFCMAIMPNNEAGKDFALHIGFTFASSECLMELKKSDYENIDFSINSNLTNTPVGLRLEAKQNKDELEINALLDLTQIGRCLVKISNNTVCLHDIEIFEKYRGVGYGDEFLHILLCQVFDRYDKAILHVTKDNTPAYNLYKKHGFKLTEQLNYYEV